MLPIKKHPLYGLLAIATDVAAIAVSFIAAYHLRFSQILIPAFKGIPSLETYLRTMILMVPLYLLIFRSYRLYEPNRHIRRIYELINVVKAVSMAAIFMMALTFFYREFSYSRAVLFFIWIFSIVFCCSARYFSIQFEYFIRRHKDKQNVLIIGMNRSSRDLIQWAKENAHYGQEIIGILSNSGTNFGKHHEGVSVLGTLEDFDKVISQYRINEIILSDPTLPRERVTELMVKCENKMIGFKLVADFYGLLTHYVDVEYISTVPLLGLKALPLDDLWNRLAKRTFDFTVSLISCAMLSPVFLLLSLVVKLSDSGPIFYQQERVGRDGKKFMLYKFRTMKVGAEAKTGPVWAQADDHRITPLGRFLRRTNLDELPQLWNVLLGSMSLVGPRPERPYFVEKFRDQIPRYMTRHKVKSGLTGWAQIHGLRGNTSLEERIRYDLYYMENWTMMMDIEILFVTLIAFKNAY